MRHLVWFSCGAASAVAAKMAIERYPDCEVLYCDTLAFEHPDNLRFLKDVEKWIGRPIQILKSDKYRNIYDVFNKTGWLIGIHGARCTTELKRNVRKKYQRRGDIHIFRLTFDEQNRIDLFEHENLEVELEWILDDMKITKKACYQILVAAGLALPVMYTLGYGNNNCIGCVKGGKGIGIKSGWISLGTLVSWLPRREKWMLQLTKAIKGMEKEKEFFWMN